MARQRIAEIAQQKGIQNPTQLMRRAEIGLSTARRIWKEVRYMPDWETLSAIAKALEVRVTELIEDEEAQ